MAHGMQARRPAAPLLAHFHSGGVGFGKPFQSLPLHSRVAISKPRDCPKSAPLAPAPFRFGRFDPAATPSANDRYFGEAESALSFAVSDPPIALEPGGEARQTPQCRLRKTAEGDFLNAIRERSHHEIATQSRRLGAIKPPPFLTHGAEVEGLKSREPTGDVTARRAVTCM